MGQCGNRVGQYGNRVGQYVSNLWLFNVIIIRQAHYLQKSRKKQIFADPCKNSRRKLNNVLILLALHCDKTIQDREPGFWSRFHVEVLQNMTSLVPLNKHTVFELLHLLQNSELFFLQKRHKIPKDKKIKKARYENSFIKLVFI